MPYINPEARWATSPVLLPKLTVDVPDTCLPARGLAAAVAARKMPSDLYMFIASGKTLES
jgi:hypothetical protein